MGGFSHEQRAQLPDAAGKTILESNRPVALAKGITRVGNEGGSAVYDVVSGQYEFWVR